MQLFTIAKIWKQLKCPSNTFIHRTLFGLKTKGYPIICDNIDGPGGHYAELNQS
jgi:hypothetical protein